MKYIVLWFLVLTSSIVQATPSRVNAPVNGSGWSYNQHGTGYHVVNGGVGDADDTMAWDINFGSGADDNGMPVYAVEEGTIYTGNGWGGSSVGQVLINHTINGDEWSTGYLHMTNIVKKSGSVNKGDIVGYISDKGTPGSIHLHFAVYDSHGKQYLDSVNVNIDQTSYPLNQLEVFDFWQSRSDLTYPASCSEGENIIDAQFKVKNITSNSIYINKLALAVHHSDGSHFFDMNLWDSEQSLQVNDSLHLRESSAWITELGQYELIAKSYYDNEWHKIGSQNFSVVANNSCSAGGNTESNNTSWTTGAYGNNENRSEVLSISGASSLNVTISGTTESGWDYLYIYDENGNQVKRLDGSIDTSFTVNGSSITAKLITDGSVTSSGVTVSVTGGGNSTGENNESNKTSWTTGAYGDNENRSEILSISGATSLTVSVSGTTEDNYDYLYVYDENDNQVKRLDGSIDTNFTVNGSSITVTLITDGSVTRSGVTVNIVEGSNTDIGDNSEVIEEFINKCINKYSGYFGIKSGNLYICDSDYFCQNTTGGNLGDVTKISIHQELEGNQFRYYWGGWGELSLDACD